MTDILTSEQRHRCMSNIRSTDTVPELIVRRTVHRLGYRYKLHQRNLPACPDLVFPKHNKIILVHGCFWHMHKCKYGKVVPKTNTKFWQNKRAGNVLRDRQNQQKLRKEGWKVFVVWECQIKDMENLSEKIKAFLQK